MKRSPMPKRRKPIARGSNIRRRNEKRSRERRARNFGDEADILRLMPCRLSAAMPPRGLGWHAPGCRGDIVPAHVCSRGAGGGRFDIIPLCQGHHDEQHACGIETFATRYGLDLRAEADRIALGHPRPLGIRGLADRWTGLADAQPMVCDDDPATERLGNYELSALLGWVRREIGRSPAVTRLGKAWAIVEALGLSEHNALTLCEAAGWPKSEVGHG